MSGQRKQPLRLGPEAGPLSFVLAFVAPTVYRLFGYYPSGDIRSPGSILASPTFPANDFSGAQVILADLCPNLGRGKVGVES